jgi:hypothetical protein
MDLDVAFIFSSIEANDFCSTDVVSVILQHVGIAEDWVCSVDVDDSLSGLRFGGGASALVPESDAAGDVEI